MVLQIIDLYEKLQRSFTRTDLINYTIEYSTFRAFKQRRSSTHCIGLYLELIPRQIHGCSRNFLQHAPGPLLLLVVLGHLTTLIQLYRFMLSNWTNAIDDEHARTGKGQAYGISG
jgi:hypothetical protein